MVTILMIVLSKFGIFNYYQALYETNFNEELEVLDEDLFGIILIVIGILIDLTIYSIYQLIINN